MLRVISIDRARPADRPAIERLLEANGLPTAGFDLAAATAVVAREGSGARGENGARGESGARGEGGRARGEGGAGEIVGCAAVEPYGSVGLLRSVCVAPGLRSAGLGRRLVAEAEAIATGLGIGQLFLLTETAGDWFPRLGYERVGKGTVPAQLRTSPEFTGACPESALLLRKILDRPAGLG